MDKKGLVAALEGAELLAAFTDTHGSAAYGALKKAVEMFLDDNGEQPEWDGTGLPPVGCECEFYCVTNEWCWDDSLKSGANVRVVAHAISPANVDVAIFTYLYDGMSKMGVEKAIKGCFRPIRTEAEKRREADVKRLCDLVSIAYDSGEKIAAEAILDAGFTRKPDEQKPQ